MISVGCSHQPAIRIPPPDFQHGFFKLDMYSDSLEYGGEAVCLTEDDFRELYTFLLNAEEFCIEKE